MQHAKCILVRTVDDAGEKMDLSELRRLTALENNLQSASQKVTDLELLLQLVCVLPQCKTLKGDTDYMLLTAKFDFGVHFNPSQRKTPSSLLK